MIYIVTTYSETLALVSINSQTSVGTGTGCSSALISDYIAHFLAYTATFHIVRHIPQHPFPIIWFCRYKIYAFFLQFESFMICIEDNYSHELCPCNNEYLTLLYVLSHPRCLPSCHPFNSASFFSALYMMYITHLY